VAARARGLARRKRAVMLGRARSARLRRRSVKVKFAHRYLGSGGAVVLVDDTAEDVTASDRAALASAGRVGDSPAELQATVSSCVVVVADVLGGHGLEMSS
jgi:hypothetical protein